MNAPESHFKLALIQMRVIGGAKEANLARAMSLIEQATQKGAAVTLLPEAMNLGWTHSSARTEAEEIPGGPSCRALADAARRYHLYICSGLIERSGRDVFNSAVLIAPDGALVAHQRKLNELAIAHSLYALGDRLQVARTPLGSLGLMICADAFVPGQVITRALGYMGAQVVLSPSAWAVPNSHDNAREPYGRLWLDNYGPVARDFRLWIAGVSNVGWIEDGPWKGRRCIGNSLVVGPSGEAALTGPYGVDAETILYIDIEPVPRPAQGDQWTEYWAARKPAEAAVAERTGVLPL